MINIAFIAVIIGFITSVGSVIAAIRSSRRGGDPNSAAATSMICALSAIKTAVGYEPTSALMNIITAVLMGATAAFWRATAVRRRNLINSRLADTFAAEA